MGILRRYESAIYGPFRKAGCVAGLWSGALLSAYLLVRWLANVPVNAPQTYGSDLVLLGCMLLAGFLYRRKLPEGKVTLKELMQMNLWLAAVAAVVFGLFTWFYGTGLDGEFLQRCLQTLIEGEQQGSSTPEQKAQTIAVMQTYTAGTMGSIAAFRTLVMSILWAFIAALLLRNEHGNVVGTGLFGKKK